MNKNEEYKFQNIVRKIIDDWISEAKNNSEYWSETDEKMIKNDLIDEMKDLLQDMRM